MSIHRNVSSNAGGEPETPSAAHTDSGVPADRAGAKVNVPVRTLKLPVGLETTLSTLSVGAAKGNEKKSWLTLELVSTSPSI